MGPPAKFQRTTVYFLIDKDNCVFKVLTSTKIKMYEPQKIRLIISDSIFFYTLIYLQTCLEMTHLNFHVHFFTVHQ